MTVHKITDKQKEQLLQIVPSRDETIEYRPCQVTLKNGVRLDNVYIQEEQSYFKTWGIMPYEDMGKRYVLIEDVTDIKESPNRLPVELANKIYKAGETGMGYCLYKLIMDNGQKIDVGTGNAVDFAPIPEGLTSKNIKDVLPHLASRRKYVKGPEYHWCIFKGDIPKVYANKTFDEEIESKTKRTWWRRFFGSDKL